MGKNGKDLIVPRNVDLEQEVLGTLLMSAKQLPEVENILDETCFVEDLHQRIFLKIIDLVSQDLTANPVTLQHYFDGEAIGDLPVTQYLARLVSMACAPSLLLKACRLLKDIAVRRKFMWACESGMYEAGEGDARTGEAIDQHLSELQVIRVALGSGSDDSVNAGVAALEAMDVAEGRMGSKVEISGMETGLKGLDKMLGGFQPGDLYIIGGRPSMGKTTVITGFAIAAAERQNKGVLIISAEMTASQLSERMMCDLTYDIERPIHYNRIANGRISADEAKRCRLAGQSLKDFPIEVNQKGGPTIAEVRSAAYAQRTFFQNNGIEFGLLVVDYLGLIKPTNRYSGNRVYETGEITAALKSLAKELKVPVVCLSQLSRQVETRDDKRPILSDLRSSGDVEQDADAVVFLYRDSYYLERSKPKKVDLLEWDNLKIAKKREIELIVAKNRHGPIGTVTAYCDIGSSVIRDAGFDSKLDDDDQGFDI